MDGRPDLRNEDSGKEVGGAWGGAATEESRLEGMSSWPSPSCGDREEAGKIGEDLATCWR